MMRILFDQGTPVPHRHWLTSHQVETAWQRGWAELSNGDLLSAAESASFDLFITTFHPAWRSARVTSRSRSVLRDSFAFQNARFPVSPS